MKIKKLSFILCVFVCLALVVGLVSPLVLSGGLVKADVAYAATSMSNSTEDWTQIYNGNYYDGINSTKTGSALRDDIAKLITDTHKTYTTYSGLANAFKAADADPNKNGNVIWFYTGTSVSFKSFAGQSGGTNREHVWPKNSGNAFPAESGPGADAHHLRPTECDLNSTRGSKSFDEVAKTTSNRVKENGSTSYGNNNDLDTFCYTSGSFFYPAKGYRGATARILFYLQTRWGDQYNLTFVDSSGKNKTIGKISTLMKWHLEEPPTDEEIRRNEAVFKMQGNRNPFIDHPEYAAMIYCNDGQSYNNALKNVVDTYGNYNDERAELQSLSLTPNTLSLTVGGESTLSVSATPSNANAKVTWSSSDTSVATVNNGKVTAVSNGIATITATSVENTNIKATATVNVKKATAIEIIGEPTIKQYQAGQTFNPTGLTVKITYDDNSTANFNSVGDLKQFEWLDASTNQPTLMETTTTIKCKFGDIEQTGNWTVSVTAPPEQLSGFITSVNAVTSETNLQSRFDAIKTALEAYNKLSADEKNNVSAKEAYQTLLNAIADYNADVDIGNDTMQNATKSGAYAIVSVTLAAAALVVLLQRKFN